ncbi:MAG: hypothetical protein ACXW34_02405 [Nitrospira sp.]
MAAVFVGVGYERILSGQGEPKIPSVITGFWTPFSSFADSISVRVTKRIADRTSRFDRLLIAKIAESRETVDAFKNLARSLTRDVGSLDKKISDIQANHSVLGDTLAQEKQVLVYYAEVNQAPRWLDLLRDAKLIDDETFKSFPSDSGIWSRFVVISLPVLLVLIFFASNKLVDQKYYLWRLAKSNATVTDQWRTREALTGYVTDPETTLTISARIGRLARGPIMQPDRLEIALQVLIAGAKRANNVPQVAWNIVGALRTPAVDNRTRLQSALMYLAQYQTGADPCLDTSSATLPKQLCEWKPTDGDSIVDIEDRIDRWIAFWTRYFPSSRKEIPS